MHNVTTPLQRIRMQICMAEFDRYRTSAAPKKITLAQLIKWAKEKKVRRCSRLANGTTTSASYCINLYNHLASPNNKLNVIRLMFVFESDSVITTQD